MEPCDVKMLDPNAVYDAYTTACEKNDCSPIEELPFFKELLEAMSGLLGVAASSKGYPGLSKFPVDHKNKENRKIWCLMVPCSDDMLRVLFGEKDDIDSAVEHIIKSIEKRQDENIAETEVNPIDQF